MNKKFLAVPAAAVAALALALSGCASADSTGGSSGELKIDVPDIPMIEKLGDFEKEVNAVRSVEQTRALTGGSVNTFDQWLAKNKAAVLAAANPAPAATPA